MSPGIVSIFEMLGVRAFVLGLVLVVGGSGASAEVPLGDMDGRSVGSFAERVADVLTAPLAAVLHPVPALPSDAMEDKLAWVAELARRADLAHGYSRKTAWRVLMGWPEVDAGVSVAGFVGAAEDTSLLRYPVPGGRRDPALDFAASVALAWLDARRFSCDFPLRARFLVDHGLVRGPLPIELGKCRDFERWAELERVEAVEAMYATPSWSDPSASMGHILFRIRHKGDVRVTGQSFEPVFAYAAIDDPATPFYMLKGLVGELTASMTFEAMGEVQARYGQRESRDLVLFELKLDSRELRFLLAEVYVQRMRKMAVPYAFLTTNCATMAYGLMRAVMPELPRRTDFMMHPHEVVSALLEAGRAKPVGVLPSGVTRARHAERVLGNEAASELERVDAAIDLETWAIDYRMGEHSPNVSSPKLDALLDRRAELPIGGERRFLPATVGVIGRSGSRSRAIEVGLDDRGRVFSTGTVAVIDEPLGAPRTALLRASGRMRLMASETTASYDGKEARLESQRLVVVSTTTLGDLPRSELGAWGGLGFVAHVETLSAPGEGLDFGAVLAGGPALSLWASEDFGDHVGVSLSAVLGTFDARSGMAGAGHDLRLAIAPELFAAVRIGDGHALRVMGRASPGWSFPAGFLWDLEAEARLEVVLSRSGILWRTSGRVRWDGPRREGWEVSTGVVF